ncbi:protoheme IX farnesyltransferase [Panacibacter ginsenosidivorans]|uniref:Protoheme IX farnesyltransferase n=1 Tax=Panacibacter ginsenosidivorans TaxID=1813871 RepID=A0A5B8V9N2_9BACT|nr:heme o synthase [Panacibacter ginsenosidivorans]QEC67959.1 protoheme IX farnesyltransferase [Panacibacter ginsenosidivorans]
MSKSLNTSTSFSLASKVKDYFLLIKFTLSFTVVFSCVICYLLAPNIVAYDLKMIIILFVAGMLVTGSANAINQASEKDTDALMKRTIKRPVASGRMNVTEAYAFAFIAGIVGVWLMYEFFNLSSALLSAFSLFLYAYIYTPLKKISSVSVLVGAFPGAVPCLIGWVAATNAFSPFAIVEGTSVSNAAGWALFGIQFLWQFPHFWAIAWVAHNDYSKAGFKLLPGGNEPTRMTALQAIAYAVMMIPVGILPFYFGLTGTVSMWIVIAANVFIVIQCVRLYIEMDVKAARRVMFSSYIYLPVVFLALLADKIPLNT